MCPRCKSQDVIASQPVVDGAVVLGAQVGSVLGGTLLIATGPLAILVGLLAGAALGGCGGYKAAEAIDSRWKYVCQECGCTWKQSD
jgi:hypothetical protein